MNMYPSVLLDFPSFRAFKDSFGPNSESDFTLVNINIRSLRKYWDEFKHIAEDATNFVDVFVLTEINIPESSTQFFAIKGYSAEFITRSHRRGVGLQFCE